MSEKITKKEQRAASDARIMASAIKRFGENGYNNSTLAQIAKDADVTGGLLVQRYESKEKLLLAAYREVMNARFSDATLYAAFPICLYRLIEEFKEFKRSASVEFDFFRMIINNSELPALIMEERKAYIENRHTFKAILNAQKEGIISKADPNAIFQSFILQVVNQIAISYRFGLEYPEDDYFLRIFQVDEDVEIRNELKKNVLLDILSKEYQSVWLVKKDTLDMEVIAADDTRAVNGSVRTVVELNNYDKARTWYIDNAVVENNRARMKEQTAMENILAELNKGKQYFVEYGRLNDGEINYNQLCYDKVCNDNGELEYVFLGFRNIDIRKEAEIDDLTGLLIRHKFLEKAERLMEERPNDQFDIVISDIVDFKKVNETYGIKTADDILRWNGDLLAKLMSENVLVGRYGGDQMVIFAVHDDFVKTREKLGNNYLLRELSESKWPDLVMKFGVYENIRHDRSVISSCDKAHMALNSIKHQYDVTTAYYNDEFKEKLDKRRRIESCMHASMKNGDFKVYYQPKHDAMTGELVGAEALVRWIHPEYGFMNPGDFIPVFELNGFIVENDRYVWQRTCENLRRWKEKGIKTVPISVNASKLTMSSEDVAKRMEKPVQDNGISPSQLHVEITETLMSDNTDELVDLLNNIRSVGFEIELDDFGSGYSSINILSTFPLDVVKLDMSFMQQFGDEKRAKVLAACINLAKELGFRTVSEGVEYEEQKDVLGALGVDMIQGYYYSKPLPEEEFEKYMINHLGMVV